MSSLTRRLQIRMLKARGFRRTKFAEYTEIDGTKRLKRVPRGGLIVDPNGDPVGYRWPKKLAA